MNHRKIPLTAGLYIVSTPIGNARDITLRALDILASVDVIAAEDTRTARKIMDIHGVPTEGRSFVAYHDHSKAAQRDRLIGAVRDGQSIAYVSEAGTPLVADPGFKLAADMQAAGLPVTAAPGASAVLTALAVGGLPTDAFHFAGFLPNASAARSKGLALLKDLPATVVLYESPKRLAGLLADIGAVMSPDRQVVVCRELTKKFEEVLRGTAQALQGALKERTIKGEIVVLIARSDGADPDLADIKESLLKAMETMRVKDAATAVAGASGLARRDVYQMALDLKKDQGDDPT